MSLNVILLLKETERFYMYTFLCTPSLQSFCIHYEFSTCNFLLLEFVLNLVNKIYLSQYCFLFDSITLQRDFTVSKPSFDSCVCVICSYFS